MVFGAMMGGGAILLGVMIALTEALKWPRWLHYLWATVAVIWGVALYFLFG